jgi:hypothetical protein
VLKLLLNKRLKSFVFVVVCFLEYSYEHKIEENNSTSTELSVSALTEETLNLGSNKTGNNDKWVTVTTAWRVRR